MPSVTSQELAISELKDKLFELRNWLDMHGADCPSSVSAVLRAGIAGMDFDYRELVLARNGALYAALVKAEAEKTEAA